MQLIGEELDALEEDCTGRVWDRELPRPSPQTTAVAELPRMSESQARVKAYPGVCLSKAHSQPSAISLSLMFVNDFIFYGEDTSLLSETVPEIKSSSRRRQILSV